MTSKIEDSVRHVAAAWKDSPYYLNAERWTHLFWDEGSVFRRYFDRLNLDFAVELACGHGRHSERVAGICSHLVVMDVHPENMDACRERLRSYNNIDYLQCNGYDYRPLEDERASAVFCYDAMVHFAPDVIASYLADTRRILNPGGRALFHHSNYMCDQDQGYGANPHSRNIMSLEIFRELTEKAGLRVIDQQSVAWGGIPHLDGLTLVGR